MSSTSIAKPRKHAEIIKAWADNTSLIVQFRNADCHEWSEAVLPPLWREDTEYRIRPERKYPETRMSVQEVCRALNNDECSGAVVSDDAFWAAHRVANAALRHAIDAGQLIEPVNKYLAKRDLAIATAVRDACRNNFLNHGFIGEVTAYARISNVSLEGIIAQVKP